MIQDLWGVDALYTCYNTVDCEGIGVESARMAMFSKMSIEGLIATKLDGAARLAGWTPHIATESFDQKSYIVAQSNLIRRDSQLNLHETYLTPSLRHSPGPNILKSRSAQPWPINLNSTQFKKVSQNLQND